MSAKKKSHIPYIGSIRDEIVKRVYDKLSSVLEDEPSDVFSLKYGSSMHIRETTIIIEKDYKRLSERFLNFVIKCINILLQVAKHRELWTALYLTKSLTATFNSLNFSRLYIKRVVDCKAITARNKREPKKDGRFFRVLVRGVIKK